MEDKIYFAVDFIKKEKVVGSKATLKKF